MRKKRLYMYIFFCLWSMYGKFHYFIITVSFNSVYIYHLFPYITLFFIFSIIHFVYDIFKLYQINMLHSCSCCCSELSVFPVLYKVSFIANSWTVKVYIFYLFVCLFNRDNTLGMVTHRQPMPCTLKSVQSEKLIDCFKTTTIPSLLLCNCFCLLIRCVWCWWSEVSDGGRFCHSKPWSHSNTERWSKVEVWKDSHS